MKTIVGFIRAENEKIWFWIACWQELEVIEPDDEPVELPLAA